jgi:hypothetical protein
VPVCRRYREVVGVVLAMTLPGLVLLLLALAAVDQLLLRLRGRGLMSWRAGAQVGSTGFELLHASLSPGKADELAQRRTEELVRMDDDSAAPPRSRIDLVAGVAHIRLDRGAARSAPSRPKTGSGQPSRSASATTIPSGPRT